MDFYYSESIRQDLTYILNKGFCHTTYVRAAKKYNAIQADLLEVDKVALWEGLFSIVICPKVKFTNFANCIKAIRDRRSEQDSLCVNLDENDFNEVRRANYLIPVRRGC